MLAAHEWADCSACFPGLAICLSCVRATTSVRPCDLSGSDPSAERRRAARKVAPCRWARPVCPAGAPPLAERGAGRFSACQKPSPSFLQLHPINAAPLPVLSTHPPLPGWDPGGWK